MHCVYQTCSTLRSVVCRRCLVEEVERVELRVHSIVITVPQRYDWVTLRPKVRFRCHVAICIPLALTTCEYVQVLVSVCVCVRVCVCEFIDEWIRSCMRMHVNEESFAFIWHCNINQVILFDMQTYQ